MSIEKNIRTRKAVDAFMELAADLITPDIDEKRFWLEIAGRAAQFTDYELTVRENKGVMEYDECLKFEQSVVPFGNHAGRLVREVDLEYWIIIIENDFARQLQRWMRSKRFRDLQENRDRY